MESWRLGSGITTIAAATGSDSGITMTAAASGSGSVGAGDSKFTTSGLSTAVISSWSGC